jgi:tRNA threonylcarbamoyladenosine biosynthesis protein TsaE
MVEFESRSPGETERIAAELARDLAAGDLVTVAGDLGAGKTTFIRGACRALGVTAAVSSPTYAIGNRYRGRVDVSHLDLYRFDSMSERDWGDLEEYFDGAVAFVEWPEVGDAYLTHARARVRLRLGEDVHRLIEVQSG